VNGGRRDGPRGGSGRRCGRRRQRASQNLLAARGCGGLRSDIGKLSVREVGADAIREREAADQATKSPGVAARGGYLQRRGGAPHAGTGYGPRDIETAVEIEANRTDAIEGRCK